MTDSSADPCGSKAEREIKKAEATLYCEVNVTDSNTGEVTMKRIETQLYRDYLEYQRAYNNARIAYTAAMQEAYKTAKGRNTWPLVAGTMQLRVKQAYDRWRAAGASEVEQALAVLSQTAGSRTERDNRTK